jgi:hypothetical protein
VRQGAPSQSEILPEAIDLMHPLAQDRHDADVALAAPPRLGARA